MVGFFVFDELVVEEETQLVGFDAVLHDLYGFGFTTFGFRILSGRVPAVSHVSESNTIILGKSACSSSLVCKRR